MLEELRLRNYRGFNDHRLRFRSYNLIVGKNNAGKSTVAEALRLLSIVSDRYRGLSFQPPPSWLDIHARGLVPSMRGLELNFHSLFHRYQDPPAFLEALFDSGSKIRMYLGPDEAVFATVSLRDGTLLSQKSHLRHAEFSTIRSLPPIGPLLREENLLSEEHVRKSQNTSVAPSHFRNQLLMQRDHFGSFRELAESTWPGLGISPPTVVGGKPSIMIREGDFAAEVGWMGHGLQIWLQIMWFLARSKDVQTVVLDEPDVYLHADVQRKLVPLTRDRFPQVIIASHSVEIMSECEPAEVLVVDRKKAASRFAVTRPDLQRVINEIGGIHNIQLAKLTASGKCLLVEGKDMSILKILHRALFPKSHTALDALPYWSTGGWGGLSKAIGVALVMNQTGESGVKTYCLLDRDYHSDESIARALSQARGGQLELHIWKVKEIENHLVVPSAIARFINKNQDRITVSATTIEAEIEEYVTLHRNEVTDTIAESLRSELRLSSISEVNRRARDTVLHAWSERSSRWGLFSGKALLGHLTNWSQGLWSVSFGANGLARELRKSEINFEIQSVLRAIEQRDRFEEPRPHD